MTTFRGKAAAALLCGATLTILRVPTGVSAFVTTPVSKSQLATTPSSVTCPKISCRQRQSFSRSFVDSSSWIVAATSSNKNDNDENENSVASINLAESDQTIVGAVGTLAALITLYSEFTLKTTGCGLPAGPFGLVGLVEGLSYLSVIGLAAFSFVTKIQTGRGLPAGPLGLLGAAEGLSFLAIALGLVVLVLQVTNYGYIPNAVPMEGGMCS